MPMPTGNILQAPLLVRSKDDPATWYQVSSGLPGPDGETGPQGPSGPTGPPAQATVMVGEFTTQTAASLPVDGNIAPDWDGVGTFPNGLQMVIGESLIDNNPADVTDFGYLFTFVGPGDVSGWIRVGAVVGPAGVQGPTGPSGPQGIQGPDEVYVGPTQPVAPTDIWYDPTADPPTPDGLWDWSVMREGIHTHHIYGGLTSAGASWTWTLRKGAYLCLFNMSAVATANGIRYVNLNMGGTGVGQSKMYFNTINSHQFMNTGVSVIDIPADGDYSFDLTVSASCTIDQNDFGHMTLIPARVGAVH